MARGGARDGAGRKLGAVSQRSRDIANGVIEDDRISPLDYMLQRLRDETLAPAERFQAAQAAAPYVHAKLSTVDATVKGALGMTVEIVRFGTPES